MSELPGCMMNLFPHFVFDYRIEDFGEWNSKAAHNSMASSRSQSIVVSLLLRLKRRS